MSVIVYDGHMIAADMRATNANGNIVKESKLTKLVIGGKNYFVATCGSSRFVSEVLGWMEGNLGMAPSQRAEFPAGPQDDFLAVVMYTDDNGMHKMECYEGSRYPDVYQLDQQNKHAFGSGAQYALGAMAMKANAVTAVKVASMLNAKCGDGYEAYIVSTGQYFRHDFYMDWNSDVPKEEPGEPVEEGV